MDRTKFDSICQELQVPQELVEHIWVEHPLPAGETDDESRLRIEALVTEHVIGAILAHTTDGLAA